MTVANQFFVYPFAKLGDTTTVPDDGTEGGSVSYEYGFGSNYQLPLNSNPSALPINRAQFNQLMQDITSAIGQYQTEGAPDWITTAQNLGTPFPYDIYARVRYNPVSPGVQAGMLIYENQVQGNTATPGADTSWLVISGDVGGVATGTVIDFAGTVAPSGYLLCNSTPQSRTTYAALLSVLTFSQSAVLSSNTTVSGLSSTANMFVGMPVEGTDIQVGTTVASIVNSTTITVSLAATGTITTNLTFFPWGNGNGSTTFNVPNLNGKTTAGSGGSILTGVIGNVTGQSGGAQNYQLVANDLPAHTHPYTYNNLQSGGANAFQGGPNYQNTSVSNSTSANATLNNAISLMQPTAIVNKIIKF